MVALNLILEYIFGSAMHLQQWCGDVDDDGCEDDCDDHGGDGDGDGDDDEDDTYGRVVSIRRVDDDDDCEDDDDANDDDDDDETMLEEGWCQLDGLILSS